ncbi:hypothetical protein SPONN_2220 [uncultured Candidatus Thioglobus sp.]|nr:hypothetical protein SPONN_2220 [uncultured Candidatus Thioglobus sp.]
MAVGAEGVLGLGIAPEVILVADEASEQVFISLFLQAFKV